jgi:hypothetical protein
MEVPVFRTKGAAIYKLMVAVLFSIALTGCGSGSNNNHVLSQAQAQAVAGAFSQATSDALQTSFGATAESKSAGVGISSAMADIQLAQSTGCTPVANGEICNFPVSSNNSQPCTDGGTIAVAGSISGTVNNNGSGSLSAQFTLTPQNCAVDGVVINAPPTIAGTGTITLVNSAPTLPITLSEVGNINFGAGACPVNLTYSVTSTSSCTVSGTACGTTISSTC